MRIYLELSSCTLGFFNDALIFRAYEFFNFCKKRNAPSCIAFAQPHNFLAPTVFKLFFRFLSSFQIYLFPFPLFLILLFKWVFPFWFYSLWLSQISHSRRLLQTSEGLWLHTPVFHYATYQIGWECN